MLGIVFGSIAIVLVSAIFDVIILSRLALLLRSAAPSLWEEQGKPMYAFIGEAKTFRDMLGYKAATKRWSYRLLFRNPHWVTNENGIGLLWAHRLMTAAMWLAFITMMALIFLA